MGPRRNRDRAPRWHTLSMIGSVALAASAGAMALGATPAFAARTANATSPTTVTEEKTPWGQILALSGGWTVYRLVGDSNDKSTCSGECAKIWPPVLLARGQKRPDGKGVSHLGSFTRAGGEHQVSYEGVPLYTFIGDKKADQINGNVKDTFGQWWVVNPAHPKAAAKKVGGSGAGKTGSAGTTTTTIPGSGVAY
jgi:predicted lipoprotein with Yx(FWY)xxD motif